MIPQEFKDQAAMNNGYNSWRDMEEVLSIIPHNWVLLRRTEEAAELYAKSKWQEACDEQKHICADQFINSMEAKISQPRAKEYCLEAPQPEFKP